jgi:hypothetical protein
MAIERQEHDADTSAEAGPVSSACRAASEGGASTLIALQHTIGNQAVQRMLERDPATEGRARRTLQRREMATPTSPRDWTTSDRLGETARWTAACLTNLNALDPSQYRRIVERRDFYKWFYRHTAALGYTTRWALAASIVADGAHQIADMDEHHSIANDALGMANVELQGIMREGNQVIFENVLPKLKRLLDGGPITGRAALQWDMQVLAEEQALIQPLYGRMSEETMQQLSDIARKRFATSVGAWFTNDDRVVASPYNRSGTVPAFDQRTLRSIGDRWTYGMNLGNRFSPSGTGFVQGTDVMPAVGAGYLDGSELARTDTRAALHELDAWLNPNRLAHVGSGSDLNAIIGRLTAAEGAEVLADRSPDGWAYSIQLAQFSFITEAMVRAALPVATTPARLLAVAAFLTRYRTERARVAAAYPRMVPFGP